MGQGNIADREKVGPYKLTPRQVAVYRWVADFYSATLRFPSLLEIVREFDLAGPAGASSMLRPLVRKGVLRQDARTSRGYSFVGIEDAVRAAVADQVGKVLGHTSGEYGRG